MRKILLLVPIKAFDEPISRHGSDRSSRKEASIACAERNCAKQLL